LCRGQAKIEPDGKMVRMPTRPSSYFLDRASICQGVVQGRAQRFRDEADAVKAIAFPAAVWPDQKGQWT
jgi:hypothetical protein